MKVISSKTKKIELLAPARTREIGIAAINCGADAVYIGAETFSAREDAGNSVADIAALAAYAHRYWARVYVALNTILRDDELPRALKLINQLHTAGVDGLIIQDVGLLECNLPPLPLIASTQLDNYSPEQVRFLEQVGFQRVILARELNVEEIRAIRSATSVELECFVHGALCVSRSGRCYLSYAVGGRSGNRGVCAQPCRLRYSLHDAAGRSIARDRYLLSLKDLNRAHSLGALLQAGITSFKIEGRLKNTDYVMNVVAFYRRELDMLLDGQSFTRASSGTSVPGFAPDPVKTFNREFTDFFMQTDSRVACLDSPKSRGELLGRVIDCDGISFVLDTPALLSAGDGVCFVDPAEGLQGTRIRSVERGRAYPEHMHSIVPGTVIYRNLDRTFQKALQQAKPTRTLAITCVFQETPDGFMLSARDEDNVSARAILTAPHTPAEKPEQALQTIQKQLTRFGGTEFKCASLDIQAERACFIPASTLNNLRRDMVEKLRSERERLRPRPAVGPVKNDVPFYRTQLGFEANVLNEKAQAFYQRHGVVTIAPALEAGPVKSGTIVMRSRYCLRRELGLCGKALTRAGFQEPLYLTDPDGSTCRLEFDCTACEMKLVWLGREE
jgi:23S rRNA 5-hydroxycytidine C2501 synthase